MRLNYEIHEESDEDSMNLAKLAKKIWDSDDLIELKKDYRYDSK